MRAISKALARGLSAMKGRAASAHRHRQSHPETEPADTTRQRDRPVDDVTEASRESFPASDPPSHNPGVAAPTAPKSAASRD